MASTVLATEVQSMNVHPTGGAVPIQLENMYSGMVLSVTPIRYSRYTTTSTGYASGILFGGTFEKLRADTYIRATCTVFGNGFQSGNCAVGMKLDNSWDYGCAYQYDGVWAQQTQMIFGTSYWTSVMQGVHNISVGWNTINNSSNERPFTTLNPNNNQDARNQQFVSTILVYEVYP
jgi:hypothetical protein